MRVDFLHVAEREGLIDAFLFLSCVYLKQQKGALEVPVTIPAVNVIDHLD
jgi:hypothetical protein